MKKNGGQKSRDTVPLRFRLRAKTSLQISILNFILFSKNHFFFKSFETFMGQFLLNANPAPSLAFVKDPDPSLAFVADPDSAKIM